MSEDPDWFDGKAWRVWASLDMYPSAFGRRRAICDALREAHALGVSDTNDRVASLAAEVTRLTAENARFRETLTWYSHTESYVFHAEKEAGYDLGNRARRALWQPLATRQKEGQ